MASTFRVRLGNTCAAVAVLVLWLVPTLTVAISDQCASETEILSTNQAVLEARSGLPQGGCIVYVDVEDSCSLDFAPFSPNYEETCVAQGGQFRSFDVTLDCSTVLDGKQYDTNYFYQNFPACLGISCTAADIQIFERLLYEEVEENTSQQGSVCEASGAGSATKGLVMVVVLSVASVMSVLN